MLAIVAGGLTLTRLLWPYSTAVGVTVLAVSVGLAAVLVALTSLRDHALAKDGARGPDGVLLAVVTGGTSALGCAALVLVVLR